jgi:hypothetical protein
VDIGDNLIVAFSSALGDCDDAIGFCRSEGNVQNSRIKRDTEYYCTG